MALVSLGLGGVSTKLALDKSNGVTLIQAHGLGMGPVQTQMRDYAALDGASYERSRAQPRTIVLQLAATGTSWGGTGGLHVIRRRLLDAVNPHRGEPVRVYYSGNKAQERYVDAYYDAGLEMADVDGFSETIALRLVAPDPFFYATTRAVGTAGYLDYVASRYCVGMNSRGTWYDMPTNTAQVLALYPRPGGGVYVGGTFTTAGTKTVRRVGLWTGTEWQALGAGIAGLSTSRAVHAIALAPNGDVYVGGLFNTAGSTGARNVARWDVSEGYWSRLSTGVSGRVRALAINRLGNLVVGGDFNTAGAVTARRIALWDGTKWTALGTGATASVWGVAITENNQVIACGTFNTIGGLSSRRIGYWSGSNWAIPNGSSARWSISGNVYAIAITPDRLYAAGAFRTAGGISASRVAVWNGYNWAPVGAGVSRTAYVIKPLGNGNLLVGGEFNTAGNRRAQGAAEWNGYDWLHAGALLGTVRAAAEDDAASRYYAGTWTGVWAPETRTISNPGTARAFPIITVYFAENLIGATSHMMLIYNITNNKKLYFDYRMVVGETVTIDCRPGHKTVTSSFFGSINRALLVGSDLATFCLEPGENLVACFVPPWSGYSVAAPDVQVSFVPAYWGGD